MLIYISFSFISVPLFKFYESKDIGAFAAEFMLNDKTGLQVLVGPNQYSQADVAEAFNKELKKQVQVVTPPKTNGLVV